MGKNRITVTCVYHGNANARSVIEQAFVNYLRRLLICNRK